MIQNIGIYDGEYSGREINAYFHWNKSIFILKCCAPFTMKERWSTDILVEIFPVISPVISASIC